MFLTVRRFAATIVAAGLVLGMLPQASAAHCEAASPVQAGHHDDHDRKDTERAEQCPHCPPADCQRHSQCAFGLDLSLCEPPLGRGRRPEVARYLRRPPRSSPSNRPRPHLRSSADPFVVSHPPRLR
jgi:hypothetical protein